MSSRIVAYWRISSLSCVAISVSLVSCGNALHCCSRLAVFVTLRRRDAAYNNLDKYDIYGT